MKLLFTLAMMLFTIPTALGQQMTEKEWDEQAKTNIRLFPKYGNILKSDEQRKFDQEFIEKTMQQEKFKGDRTAASDHLISLGFNYLYRGDVKTAMYRFNQAYLLDDSNTDIFWGYGAVYMTLGNYQKARQQYEEGLAQNPHNPHLLTDLGTYYMAQYFPLLMMPKNDFVKNPKEQAESFLDSALIYLNKSYQIDSIDQNTTYKLSASYFYKGDCNSAWRFYDECMALGGRPISEEYTKDLKKKCKVDK